MAAGPDDITGLDHCTRHVSTEWNAKNKSLPIHLRPNPTQLIFRIRMYGYRKLDCLTSQTVQPISSHLIRISSRSGSKSRSQFAGNRNPQILSNQLTDRVRLREGIFYKPPHKIRTAPAIKAPSVPIHPYPFLAVSRRGGWWEARRGRG